MKNITVPIAIPNVTKWQALDDFRPGMGTMTIRVFYGVGQQRWTDFFIGLSDAAGGSTGVGVNPAPQKLDDQIIMVAGVGAVNALTNAGNAYRTTSGTQAVRMAAVETSIQTDGVIAAALAGT